jgi:hypothetical protein
VIVALLSEVYLLSVNRPREEQGVPLGGPSFAVAPTGEVPAESLDPLTLVRLDGGVVTRARRSYPGYLATRSKLYAQGWQQVSATRYPHEGHRRPGGRED